MIDFNLMKSTSDEIEKLLKHITANPLSFPPPPLLFLPRPLLLLFPPSLFSYSSPCHHPILFLDIYASSAAPYGSCLLPNIFFSNPFLHLPLFLPLLPMLNGLHYCNELVIYGGRVQDWYHLPIECLASPSSPTPSGNTCTHSRN